MRAKFGFILIGFLVLIASWAGTQQEDPRLTVKEVETITGTTNVHLRPFNPQLGAGGDLNFMTVENQLLLFVKFIPGEFYAREKDPVEAKVSNDQTIRVPNFTACSFIIVINLGPIIPPGNPG